MKKIRLIAMVLLMAITLSGFSGVLSAASDVKTMEREYKQELQDMINKAPTVSERAMLRVARDSRIPSNPDLIKARLELAQNLGIALKVQLFEMKGKSSEARIALSKEFVRALFTICWKFSSLTELEKANENLVKAIETARAAQ